MCTVSMIGDHYQDKWDPEKWSKQYPLVPHPNQQPQPSTTDLQKAIDDLWKYPSKQEFDDLRKQVQDLKKEVLEMKELLKRAKEYDERNNEPHCEMESKVKLLKEVAKLVGVDLEEVFGKPTVRIPFMQSDVPSEAKQYTIITTTIPVVWDMDEKCYRDQRGNKLNTSFTFNV